MPIILKQNVGKGKLKALFRVHEEIVQGNACKEVIGIKVRWTKSLPQGAGFRLPL